MVFVLWIVRQNNLARQVSKPNWQVSKPKVKCVSNDILTMYQVFSSGFKSDLSVLYGCLNGVSRIFEGCFNGVSGFFKDLSSISQWSQYCQAQPKPQLSQAELS